MSFAGSVSHMINSIKYNESLRKGKHKSYSDIKDVYKEELGHYAPFVDRKAEIPKDELLLIKQRIRNKLKNEQIKSITTTIALTLVIIGLITYFIFTKGDQVKFYR